MYQQNVNAVVVKNKGDVMELMELIIRGAIGILIIYTIILGFILFGSNRRVRRGR